MNSQREKVDSLKEYAFIMMNNTDSESDHFYWKGQYLAYCNVLYMIDQKIEETHKRIDEEIENLNVKQQKKLLDAIFHRYNDDIRDQGDEYDNQ